VAGAASFPCNEAAVLEHARIASFLIQRVPAPGPRGPARESIDFDRQWIDGAQH
jgi:hypothetical protein